MHGYRGEQLHAVGSARLERAAVLAECTLPLIVARRAARRVAGASGCALAVGYLLLATPRGLGLDPRLQPRTCLPDFGECDTTWRVAGFVVVVLVTVAIGAVVRWAALARATRAIESRLQAARVSGTLGAVLTRQIGLVAAHERASTAWPLAAAILLGPIAVHGLLVAAFGLSVFDRWISTLESCVAPAQLTMIACSVWDARIWKGLTVRQLEAERSWRRSFAVGVCATVAMGLVLFSREMIWFELAPALGVGIVVASLAALTFLAFWPLAHRLLKRWILTERSNLDDVQIAIERMDAPVRVEELAAHVSV